MGMSSSQARLLTLTARQHHVEYKAQKLQAEKLLMANDSDTAYNDYLKALDATKTVAKITLDDGTIGDTLLTANKVYTYSSLAKQYALKTQDGKTLIPETLHNAYNTTNSLSDFLNKFGLNTTYTQTIHHSTPNADYDTALDAFKKEHADWEKEVADYEQKLKEYEEKLKNYHEKEYPGWEAKEPSRDDPKYTTSTESLADKFVQAGSSCYNSAKNGSTSCYIHVLGQIIDFSAGKGYGGSGKSINNSWYDGVNNSYTTSTGKNVTITPGEYDWGTCHNTTSCPIFAEVSAKIDDETNFKPAVAAGETCDITNASAEKDKLMSKWKTDGTLKSLKQWAKDLLYICKNYSSLGMSAMEVGGTVVKFQEGLAGSLNFDEAAFNSDHDYWVAHPPDIPTPPPKPRPEPMVEDFIGGLHPTDEFDTTTDHITFKNKYEAQWYINLWYKMEGQDDVPKMKEEIIHDDATGRDVSIYSIDSQVKSTTTYGTNKHSGTTENENYIVIKDALLDDPNWVNETLKEGFVLVQYFDTVENKFLDTSTAVDTRLETQPDTIAVKKAEADYEAKMRKINKKETKTDTELSKLEAERTSIKTEQDGLKQIIKDNVDLSFKLFS